MEKIDLLQEIANYTHGQIAMAKIHDKWRYVLHSEFCQPENWVAIKSNGLANDIQSVGYNICRHQDGTTEHVLECNDCFILPFEAPIFDAHIILPTYINLPPLKD